MNSSAFRLRQNEEKSEFFHSHLDRISMLVFRTRVSRKLLICLIACFMSIWVGLVPNSHFITLFFLFPSLGYENINQWREKARVKSFQTFLLLIDHSVFHPVSYSCIHHHELWFIKKINFSTIEFDKQSLPTRHHSDLLLFLRINARNTLHRLTQRFFISLKESLILYMLWYNEAKRTLRQKKN